MKKSERNKLDKKVFSEIRERGKCERCGKTAHLQCCHIFSRRYIKLRHDPLNLLCLCAGCHLWSHSVPILFTEWVMEYLGKEDYDTLKKVAYSHYKYGWEVKSEDKM